jgi:hypothetical protein
LQRQRLGDREPFSIDELLFIHVQAGGVLDKVEVELSVVNGVKVVRAFQSSEPFQIC